MGLFDFIAGNVQRVEKVVADDLEAPEAAPALMRDLLARRAGRFVRSSRIRSRSTTFPGPLRTW